MCLPTAGANGLTVNRRNGLIDSWLETRHLSTKETADGLDTVSGRRSCLIGSGFFLILWGYKRGKVKGDIFADLRHIISGGNVNIAESIRPNLFKNIYRSPRNGSYKVL